LKIEIKTTCFMDKARISPFTCLKLKK